MKASTTLLPKKRRRPSSHPTTMATGRLNRMLLSATSRLRATAVHSSGVRVRKRPSSLKRLESVGREELLAFRAQQEVEERLDLRPIVSGNDAQRVYDRIVAVVGEGADHLDVLQAARVGRIDDAQWGLATLHERQRGAHILGRRGLRFDRVPYAQLGHRLLGIVAGRDALRIA